MTPTIRLATSNSSPNVLAPLSAIPFSKIAAFTDSSDFVEEFLGDRSLSVFFGGSNVCKTFVVLDLGLHVATGLRWCGKAVDQGGVVYFALEGGHGVHNRIAAWREAYHPPEDIPFYLVAQPISMLDSDCDNTINLIKAISVTAPMPIRLIVIDTLSRALAGQDENNSAAMGALVLSMDRIRQETGVAIIIIHHTGKDEKRGAREGTACFGRRSIPKLK